MRLRILGSIIFVVTFYLSDLPWINAQDLEIYKTNLGIKNIFPSIIIDENTITGEYEVYKVNKFGLKNINPDEIITNAEYSGTWKVYRVSDYGVKEHIPKVVAEQNPVDGNIEVFDVDQLGLTNMTPSTIIAMESFSGHIKLYNVNEYGIKDLAPYEIIKREGDNYNVYGVSKYGIPEIFPSKVVEVKEQDCVFGILLLPSIGSVKFDPADSKLHEINQIKAEPDSILKERGWLKSKPMSKVEKGHDDE